MLAQEALNTLFQLAVVLIIAGLVYLVAGKKRGKFTNFVGLTAPTGTSMAWALFAAFILAPATIALFYFTPLREAAMADNTIAGRIRGLGLGRETFALIAIIALAKTSLTEEIFFRGLIAKRLIGWLGFTAGNTIHAALFGAIHLLIFVVPGGPAFGPVVAAAFFGITGASGWLMAYLNERVGGGSIAPSWLVHGVANLIAYPVLAFA